MFPATDLMDMDLSKMLETEFRITIIKLLTGHENKLERL